MYIGRSDWRELVERLAAMERDRNEYRALALKYANELARAQAAQGQLENDGVLVVQYLRAAIDIVENNDHEG